MSAHNTPPVVGNNAGAKSRLPGGINALFGDGSVQCGKESIDPLVWLAVNLIKGVKSSAPIRSDPAPTLLAGRDVSPTKRDTGIEPVSTAWEAVVLPLNQSRSGTFEILPRFTPSRRGA